MTPRRVAFRPRDNRARVLKGASMRNDGALQPTVATPGSRYMERFPIELSLPGLARQSIFLRGSFLIDAPVKPAHGEPNRSGEAVATSSRRRAAVATCAAAVLCLAASAGSAVAQMELDGTFDVGPSGAAAYAIRIAVPPGTAGM